MSVRDPENSAPLTARNLTTGYARKNILEHLDFEILHGRFTVLIGPNGCGKSTLLRALCNLMPVRDGGVLLDGRQISEFSTKEIARRVGVLAQGPVAPEGLTVEDLARQGRYPHRSLFGQWSDKDETACRTALELTALTHLKDRAIDNLSGGQRQRAWIAMTLAQQTGILLLDEPTTYLDLAHQIEVLDLVQRLVREQQTTVVAVLHDINQAARYADHIVAMKDGRIAVQGSPEEVINKETIEAVFGVRVAIVTCPVDGAPLAIPLTGRQK